jgi:hypothetical protein
MRVKGEITINYSKPVTKGEKYNVSFRIIDENNVKNLIQIK